jgi:ribosomal-protein-alanine N-acetyltransferase
MLKTEVPILFQSLTEQSLKAFDKTETFAGWSFDDILKYLQQKGGFGFVAQEAGSLKGLGLILGRILCEQAEILTFEVLNLYRKQGIGKALLERTLSFLREKQIEKVFLEVSEENTAAQRIYNSMGFIEIGKRPHYYNSLSNLPINALVLEYDFNRKIKI